jgi:hypothetical protein
LTGFRPQTSLVDIIDRVVTYCRKKEGFLAHAVAAPALSAEFNS